jgi:hypothetical protein
MNTETIEAKHGTMTEHKVVFYIDGVKYGFRCSEFVLNELMVPEGTEIPELTSKRTSPVGH